MREVLLEDASLRLERLSPVDNLGVHRRALVELLVLADHLPDLQVEVLVLARFLLDDLGEASLCILELRRASAYRRGESRGGANLDGSVPIGLEREQLLLVDSDLNSLVLAQHLDRVECLGVPPQSQRCRTEQITHLVASKMSSNFFLRLAGSERGQLDSS